MKACPCEQCGLAGADAAVYHRSEAERIQRELDQLGEEFAPDGIVRTILRNRVRQERERAEANEANR